MTIDYAKGLTFAFSDENWLSKLGRAALWAFISALLFILPVYFYSTGYGLATARNVMAGKEKPLPELNDVGAIFSDGLKFFVVMFVYALPAILLLCIFLSIGIGTGIAAGDSFDEDAVGAAFGGGYVALQCILQLYNIALGLMQPAIMTRYLQTGEIGESLQISKVFGIFRENFVPSLMIFLMRFAAGIILQLAVGVSLITICGWIFILFAGIPWASSVNGHLVGQFASELDNPEKKLDPAAF
ncbi:MAG: DUF4013 domain-containing protein [Chloroflexota bacterium]